MHRAGWEPCTTPYGHSELNVHAERTLAIASKKTLIDIDDGLNLYHVNGGTDLLACPVDQWMASSCRSVVRTAMSLLEQAQDHRSRLTTKLSDGEMT